MMSFQHSPPPCCLNLPRGSLVNSAASITVTLHYNASVAPLDNITALANKVAFSGSTTALNKESSVIISPPEAPPVPQLVPQVWYMALAHCKVGGSWFYSSEIERVCGMKMRRFMQGRQWEWLLAFLAYKVEHRPRSLLARVGFEYLVKDHPI